MAKIICLFLSALFFLTVLVNTGTSEQTMVNEADISISGIYLSDPASTKSILGEFPDVKETGDDLPHADVCNSSGTELLTLIFHYGDVVGSFNEFRIRKVTECPPGSIRHPAKVKHFVTEKGIRLGISYGEVESILGPPHIRKIRGGDEHWRYEINDLSKSRFLQKYNLPVYYADYYFLGGKLKEFAFGFEYP